MIAFIIFILLTVLVILLSFFSNLLITILDWLARPFRRRKRTGSNSYSENSAPHQTMHARNRKRKKVIDSDDGEYVDFEEIK